MDPEKYQAALDYVFSYIDYSRTHLENIAPENFNLARMAAFLEKLGNPHQAYPCIHVAGTKGKGSVSALCAGALQAGGYRVGLYTSPHLHDFSERIQVNRQPISQQAFIDLVERLKPAAAETSNLTSYEIQTALAFWHFAESGVDFAVIEVGLGGRLDSTNVVMPLASVITSLSLDHTFILGDTLTEIAGEKGGIIKPGVPVVAAPQAAEAEAVLRQIATEKDVALTLVGQDLRYQARAASLAGQELTVSGPSGEVALSLGLLGEHQLENAALAYAALAAARTQGLQLADAAIQRGFADTRWPGRFEVVATSPAVVLDGAHNQHSAQRLRVAIEQYFHGRRLVLVFGASEDKDIAGMFAELLPHVAAILPVVSSHPRAATIAQLTALAEDYECQLVVTKEIATALKKAQFLAGPRGVVLATGSLYALGEIRAVWFTEFSERGYN